MNISPNIQVAIEEKPKQSALEQLRAINAKVKTINEKLTIAKRAEDKVAMIVKRLQYRNRIADKMRVMFGDDTANAFLAGEF
jgi:head-tail adaptor